MFDYSFLLPKTFAGWFPLTDAYANNASVTLLKDVSGNGHDLTSSSSSPTWETNTLNSLPSVKFSGSNNPLLSANNFIFKTAIILIKSDDTTTFSGYRGVISDSSVLDCLIGGDASNKFFDLTLGVNYYKSGVSYVENNQLAPFSNFEVVEVNLSGGFSCDVLQIGQQRNFTSRKFKGRICEMIFYNRILTANERKAIAFYFGCKFNLWQFNNAFLEFPNKDIFGELYQRYYQAEKDWQKITVDHEYEDGGKDFNEKSNNAPQVFEIEWRNLSSDQAQALKLYFNQRRFANAFNFTDKYGEIHRVYFKEFNCDHEGHKSWLNNVSIKLIKYP